MSVCQSGQMGAKMKYSKSIIAAFAAFFVVCCVNVSAAGNDSVKEMKRIRQEADFAISVTIEENRIAFSEFSDGTFLNEITADCEIYKVYVNMTDEENGSMMYCSVPGAKERKEVFYVTNDRWNTYSKMDEFVWLDE